MRWREGGLELLDQTLLPAEERWIRSETHEDVAVAIERLAVRGAPSIGLAAAYGTVVGLNAGADPAAIEERLASTRPTAVNLRFALERMRAARGDPRRALALAEEMARERLAEDGLIAAAGAALFEPGDRALTHCNTGPLATAGVGTAGGVLAAAHAAGVLEQVWVDETRPLLQGARLTAFELGRAGIPYRLVTDGAAGSLFARGLVERVVVGADRIAANGDFANKVGTYTLAVLAERHGIPFYVAAPTSTIDPETPDGSAIPIEERAEDEVTHLLGRRSAPAGAEAANPAFDVTPRELVSAYITEKGVIAPPFQ